MRAGVLTALSIAAIVFFCGAPLAWADDAPQLKLDVGGHIGIVTDLVFTPDSKRLISAGEDKGVRVWNVETGKTERLILGQEGSSAMAGEAYAIALSPDGRWLAIGGQMAEANLANMDDGGSIRLYDFASGRLVALLKGHHSPVDALAFSPDGRTLASGSAWQNDVLIWDVETRRLLRTLSGHTSNVY